MELDHIYNMDCLEGMKQIPDGTIDLTVTSPPYNAGIDYGECYNDNKPLHEYLAFIREVLAEVYRITKDGGRVAINVANTGRKPYIPLSSYINIMAIELGFLCRGEIIWDKGASVGTSCAWGSWRSPSNPSLRDVHEYIMIYSKGDYKHEGKGDATLEADEFTDNTKSIWQMQTANAKQVGHPAPYPEILPRRIIRLYSYTDDVIFDPFMGSGTTAIVAAKERRHFIGFELNKEYFDKAVKRIKAEQAQLTLF
jgi:site-specific DNA-methyltransferase (adenine-specific)